MSRPIPENFSHLLSIQSLPNPQPSPDWRTIKLNQIFVHSSESRNPSIDLLDGAAQAFSSLLHGVNSNENRKGPAAGRQPLAVLLANVFDI